jgi:hypothetical protein
MLFADWVAHLQSGSPPGRGAFPGVLGVETRSGCIAGISARSRRSRHVLTY